MGGTVLVVEDDADIVDLLELYLTGGGYSVISAGDGVEALELLRERSADVVLVDIMMPRMNGYDFIKELRRTSSMPVLIVSARTQPADKIVGLDPSASPSPGRASPSPSRPPSSKSWRPSCPRPGGSFPRTSSTPA